MSVFSIVKENVTALQVAERYGLKVNPKGMACCPFHKDKTPSMKIDSRYYCFGCGSTGDAVDLASQLLGVNAKDAAITVAEDFGLNHSEEPSKTKRPKILREPKVDAEQEAKEWIAQAVLFLMDFRWQLLEWKERYAPQAMNEEWHPLFCEALSKKELVESLLDELLFCHKNEYQELRKWYEKEVKKLERRLEQLRERESRSDWCNQEFSGENGEWSGEADEEQCAASVDARPTSERSISMEQNDRKNRCSKRPGMEQR